MGDGTDLVFIAWTWRVGRAEEIAGAMGGRARCIHPRALGDRRLILLRYLVSLLLTAAHLLRHRPRRVIVTNPPIFPALVVAVYARITGARFVLDSHPGGFGEQGDHFSRRMQRLHRLVATRADAVLVTTEQWVEQVRDWGGDAVIVHEAPTPLAVAPSERPQGRPLVAFLGTFGRDEPVEELLRAAADLPGADIAVTGDPALCPEVVRALAPENVRFVGYLDRQRYHQLIRDADLVVSLTTEPSSIMRAAYEAVYAERPLVVSDWPDLRRVFPHAIWVQNTPAGIRDGIGRALGSLEELRTRATEARAEQDLRWSQQLARLRQVLDMEEEAA